MDSSGREVGRSRKAGRRTTTSLDAKIEKRSLAREAGFKDIGLQVQLDQDCQEPSRPVPLTTSCWKIDILLLGRNPTNYLDAEHISGHQYLRGIWPYFILISHDVCTFLNTRGPTSSQHVDNHKLDRYAELERGSRDGPEACPERKRQPTDIAERRSKTGLHHLGVQGSPGYMHQGTGNMAKKLNEMSLPPSRRKKPKPHSRPRRIRPHQFINTPSKPGGAGGAPGNALAKRWD